MTASLPITETFLSIQGEGKLTGVPSFFVRVAGCNLRCSWCDTPYSSWTPEGAARSIDDLVAAARVARHAVITGGEPMMFAATRLLADALHKARIHVTIETAGTILDPGHPPHCDLMSISPKLANSTPRSGDPRDPGGVWRERHEARRLNIPTLRAMLDRYPERQMKFVVASPGDIQEIERVVSHLPGLADGDVMLMPEGVAPPAPGTHQWIVEECLRRGWRYCRRLHIDLFGNRRGT